jgi:hypothetical protein
MMPDDQNPHDFDEQFATIVADGAYIHFLDGYASLVFYHDKIFPKVSKNGKIILPNKRENLAEIRLSIPALKKFKNDLEDGIRTYPIFSLLPMNIDYFGGVSDIEPKGENYVDTTLDEMSQEHLADMAVFMNYETISDEGKKEFGKLTNKILLEHADELREVVQKDIEKQKGKKRSEEFRNETMP